MPVETRAVDTYTQDNLLLGFSQVTFTPLLPGGYGAAVPMGILSGQELQKEVELLELERGDAGLIVVDRELVSKLTVALQVQTFNFKADLAQYIFASDTLAAVSADAAAVITGEQVTLPTTNTFDAFVDLAHADITESSVAVTCDTITDEVVGTGTGAANNFELAFKVDDFSDVASVTVGTTSYTPILTATASTGNEVEVISGEVDGAHPTTSGSLLFHVAGAETDPPDGDVITATYTPGFTGAQFALNTDFFVDPVIGQIRFFDPSGADNSPFRTTGDNQPMLVAYTYNRHAGNTLVPFNNPVVEGKARIAHLTDVGINIIWEIPSASIRITDDAITFDAEDFAQATLILNILNDGTNTPYGTMTLSSETESA